jgi:hypothetical protein
MTEQQATRTPYAFKHSVLPELFSLSRATRKNSRDFMPPCARNGSSEEDCIFTAATLYFRKQRLPLLISPVARKVEGAAHRPRS